MASENGVLHLLRIGVDTRQAFELGRRRRLPLREVDLGYLVHCVLAEVFGEHAPGPFHLERQSGRYQQVLAYSGLPAEQLRVEAERFADPAVYEALNWASLSQKPMPKDWPCGLRLGFKLRACPIVRMSSDDARHRRGAEVDAFLARCWQVGDRAVPVDREWVYSRWFRDQIDRRQGAAVLETRLAAFQRVRLLRRTSGSDRKTRFVERPDALLEGTLEVTNPGEFQQILAKGLGRHRAFGFGMLLLRPLR